jgi:hypothetical protein
MTTALDILGAACLAVFAFFVWWPAPFHVVGVAALLISWRATSSTEDSPS